MQNYTEQIHTLKDQKRKTEGLISIPFKGLF
jgi:hypothetical protein